MRPVINLRPLNAYIRKQRFKMDSLTKVLNLVKKEDWAFSVDLQDAYMHVPIHRSHRKYLRFCIGKHGQPYQFKALCFGPKSASRVFTKIVSVVAAHLRAQSIRLAVYLDDWFGCEPMQITPHFRSHKNAPSTFRVGFSDKYRKVVSNTVSNNHVHRCAVSVEKGSSSSNIRKNGQNYIGCNKQCCGVR